MSAVLDKSVVKSGCPFAAVMGFGRKIFAAPAHQTSARKALRAATQSLHAELDSHPVTARLASHDVTVAEVTVALQGMYVAHRSLEAQLPDTLTAHFNAMGFQMGGVADGLRADLHALDAAAVPAMVRMEMPAADAAGALGALYVLIGSSLGATQISRAMRSNADSRLAQVTYFDRMAARSAQFKRLIDLLDRELASPAALASAQRAAHIVFETFLQAMNAADVASNKSGQRVAGALQNHS
jgi:heme oxygenase